MIKRQTTILLLMLLSLPSCFTPTHEPPVYSRELARIGDMIIKEDVLRFRMRLEMDTYPENFFKSSPGVLAHKPEFQEMMKTVLGKIVNDYMIIAYGMKKGIELDKKEIKAKLEAREKQWNPKSFENFLSEKNIPYSRWRQLVEDEVKVNLIMEKELGDGLKVSLNEVRSYYDKNRHEFDVPERVWVRHIVTDSLDKANDLHARLMEGENFAKMAVNHSLSPDRARGGDLGYFARGSFPKEFDDTCFGLARGEISPVVKSDYGYHIFKLLNKKPAGRKTLEEVAAQIHQKLFEEKLKEKYDPWIKEVRSKVDIKIQGDVLNNFIL